MTNRELTREDALTKLTTFRKEAEALMAMYVYPGHFVRREQIAEAQDRLKLLKQQVEQELERTQRNQDSASELERVVYAPAIQQTWTRLDPARWDSRPSQKVFFALCEFSSDLLQGIANLQESKAA